MGDERVLWKQLWETLSGRQEQSSGVHPRLPPSQRTESQFDEIQTEKEKKKFKACLSIQLESKEKMRRNEKKTERVTHF